MTTELIDAFSKIAAEENGLLSTNTKTFQAGTRLGSRASSDSLYLRFQHKGIELSISNELGQQNVGLISCRFPSEKISEDFNISRGSIVRQFFGHRENSLKVKSNDPQLVNQVLSSSHFQQLCSLAHETAFDPVISGKLKEGVLHFNVEYHLQFKERHLALKPLIGLCKGLIDFNDYKPIT